MKEYVVRYVNGNKIEVSKQVADACYLFSAKKLAKIEKQVNDCKLPEKVKQAYKNYLLVPTEQNYDCYLWACVQNAKEQYEQQPNADTWGLYSDLYKDYYGFRP